MATNSDKGNEDVLSNDVLKEAFQRQHVRIIQSLRAGDVLPHMFSEGLFTADDIAELQDIKGQMKQCGTFLMRLHRLGHPETFIKLLDGLKQSDVNYDFIVRWIVDECQRVAGDRGKNGGKTAHTLDEQTACK